MLGNTAGFCFSSNPRKISIITLDFAGSRQLPVVGNLIQHDIPFRGCHNGGAITRPEGEGYIGQ